MVQQGTGKEALEYAFRQCHAAGKDMNPGDVIGLDDGTVHRCEAEGWSDKGWSDIGKMWTTRVQKDQERLR
jgi:L-ascorbate metabolism protein UlaG (beta-lactamase superfamily)